MPGKRRGSLELPSGLGEGLEDAGGKLEELGHVETLEKLEEAGG